MALQPTKEQVRELIVKTAPEYLEIFEDFHTYDGGWLKWPPYLIKIKKHLNLDSYVRLYEDEKRITACIFLSIYGEKGARELAEQERNMSNDEKQTRLNEYFDFAMENSQQFVDSLLGEKPPTPEQEEQARKEYEKLPIEDQQLLTKQYQFLFLTILSSIHNYFSVMTLGEKMTSLVPKAMSGDDESFLKAVKIDRNLLIDHPYFRERFETAQLNGEAGFLKRLGLIQSTPNLISKIRYPSLYFILAILDSFEWLDKLRHEDIFDICEQAGLDKWRNRIETVNALTKQISRFRRYQRTGGVSMH